MPSKWTAVPKPVKPKLKYPKEGFYDQMNYHDEMAQYYLNQETYFKNKAEGANQKQESHLKKYHVIDNRLQNFMAKNGASYKKKPSVPTTTLLKASRNQ